MEAQAGTLKQGSKAAETDAVRMSFSSFIAELNGNIEYEAASALEALAKAVEKERKKGTFTLVFTMKPVEKVKGAVQILHDIKVKAPEPERESSMRFVNSKTGELVRNDPRQGDFEQVEASFRKAGN
jgi:hypothetical protein